jgi:hypothetical protein
MYDRSCDVRPESGGTTELGRAMRVGTCDQSREVRPELDVRSKS